MLALDDPAWRGLSDAYGPAIAIPRLIEQLRDQPATDTWEALWSALCHQYTVYSATYAAIPHLVALTAVRVPSERGPYLSFLATAIACAQASAAPQVPVELKAGYRAAVARTRMIALEAMSDSDLPRADLAIAAAALAAARGDPATAFDFMNAGEAQTCAACGARVASWGEYLTT